MGYLPACAGIYAITHLKSGKQYIGSSVYMGRRWHDHRQALRQGKHYNRALQNAWAKYGEDAFAFSVLEVVDSPSAVLLAEREQHYLDSRRVMAGNNGLNLRSEANNPESHAVSEETRQKISTALKGRKFTPERRQKLSEARQRWSTSPAFVASKQGPRPTRRGGTWSDEAKARKKAKWAAMSQADKDAIRAKSIATLKRNGRFASLSEVAKYGNTKRKWHPMRPPEL